MALAVTIRPPLGDTAKSMTSCSILSASSSLIAMTSNPSDGAMAWIMANCPIPAGMLASRRLPPRHIWRDLLKKFWPFHAQTVVELNKTGRVATRPRHCFDEARAHRVRDLCKHDWYGSRGLQQRSHRIIAAHNDRVGRKSEQLGRIIANYR